MLRRNNQWLVVDVLELAILALELVIPVALQHAIQDVVEPVILIVQMIV